MKHSTKHDSLKKATYLATLQTKIRSLRLFKGIVSKADYLKELGATGVWLSPIFKSPMIDNGYDIQDYTDVDVMFGTLSDFKVCFYVTSFQNQ